MSERYMTFQNVVRDICDFRGDSEAKSYIRVSKALRHALNEVRTLSPCFDTGLKSVEIIIGANLMASLPDDFVVETKVGVRLCDGHIRLMGKDGNLTLPAERECSCSTEPCHDNLPPAACPSCTFFNFSGPVGVNTGYGWGVGATYVRDSYMYGELYGVNPRQWSQGRYSVHAQDIIFGSGYDVKEGAKVYIEYISSLGTADAFVIPAEAFDCLFYKTMQTLDMHSAPGKAQAYFQQYRIAMNTLKRIHDNLTPEDFAAALRSRYSSTVQR